MSDKMFYAKNGLRFRTKLELVRYLTKELKDYEKLIAHVDRYELVRDTKYFIYKNKVENFKLELRGLSK